jgi:hypothetical protein
MRTRTLSPALLLSLLALSACGGNEQDEQAAKNTSQDSSRTAAAPALVWPARDDTRPRVHAPEPLELTFEQLQAGGRVLIHNPIPRDTSVRILVEDSSATAPLTQLLKGEQKVTLYGGTARQPGGTTVSLVADTFARPEADTVLGFLLVDDGKPDPYRHKVRIIVAEPRPASALGDTGTWTASIYKLAPLPGVRARFFDNAEARCSRDTKHRTGFAKTGFSRQMNELMGACLRDNVIPLAGARSDTARKAMDPAPRHTLLGVLREENGKDEGLVWWTGDTLSTGTGTGVELHFTSMDHPGAYKGRISLAGAGAQGVVSLNVRVTHDWPLALLVIILGVCLSTWLRAYVRTRRAVLDVQVASTKLMARITQTDRVLRQLDSPEPGKHPYAVDVRLRREVQSIERSIQRLARDEAALDPGKPDHDALRKRLDACYDRVTAWEDFAETLAQLRQDLDTAHGCLRELKPSAESLPDVPPLLAKAESHFAGESVDTDVLAAVHAPAVTTAAAAAAWREAAEVAVALRRALADSKGTQAQGVEREKVIETLDSAVNALWVAEDRKAAEAAGAAVHRAQEMFKPKVRALKLVGNMGRAVGGAIGTVGRGVGTLTANRADPAAAHAPPAGVPEKAVAAAEEVAAAAEKTVTAAEKSATAAEKSATAAEGTAAAAVIPEETATAAEGAVAAAEETVAAAGETVAAAEETVAAAEEAVTAAHARTAAEREADRERAAAALERRAQERQRIAETAQKRNDRWYFLLTTAVAVATGLSEVYLANPSFGTMKNYMAALLWGFGTKMGLDTVRAAVESGRLPWSKATATPEPTQQVQQGVQSAANTVTGATQTGVTQTGATQTSAAQTNGAQTQTGGSQTNAAQTNGTGAGAGGTPARQAEANAAAAGQAEGVGGSG